MPQISSHAPIVDQWVARESGRPWAGVGAMEVLVRRKFPSWQGSLPVDPYEYARKSGCRVLTKPVPAARLVFSPFGPEIWVPRGDPRSCQRWSVAHELGHLLFLRDEHGTVRSAFLDPMNAVPDAQRARTVGRIEALCNMAARILLIPQECLRQLWAADRPSLNILLELSGVFDVAPPIVFQRLAEVALLSSAAPHILLEFRENRITGSDPKWRVAAHSWRGAWTTDKRLWENSGIDRLGIDLPPPPEAVALGNSGWEARGEECVFCIRRGDVGGAWILGEVRRPTAQRTLFAC